MTTIPDDRLETRAHEIVNRHRPPEVAKLNGRELMPVAGAVAAVSEALTRPASEEQVERAVAIIEADDEWCGCKSDALKLAHTIVRALNGAVE